MVRVWGTHWFLAVCEMCVFRYRQHSSRDKPLGPPSPHPHPPLSLHPPRRVLLTQVCASGRMCVCVCVRVYVGRGSACPVPQHLQGATEKTAVNLRETENVRKRVEGQQACQSRPSLLEWVPQTLLFSFSSSPFFLYYSLMSPVFSVSLSLSFCIFILFIPNFSSTLISLLSFFVMFCSVTKIFGCIFSDIMHLPVFSIFILSHQTVMGQHFCHWLCSQF